MSEFRIWLLIGLMVAIMAYVIWTAFMLMFG